MKRAVTILAIVGVAGAMACESPEATRSRGGGSGGDPGNRPDQVKMHEGSRQYHDTPVLIPGEPMPLDPAHQARQLSLPGAQPRPQSSGDGRD